MVEHSMDTMLLNEAVYVDDAIRPLFFTIYEIQK